MIDLLRSGKEWTGRVRSATMARPDPASCPDDPHGTRARPSKYLALGAQLYANISKSSRNRILGANIHRPSIITGQHSSKLHVGPLGSMHLRVFPPIGT